MQELSGSIVSQIISAQKYSQETQDEPCQSVGPGGPHSLLISMHRPQQAHQHGDNPIPRQKVGGLPGTLGFPVPDPEHQVQLMGKGDAILARCPGSLPTPRCLLWAQEQMGCTKAKLSPAPSVMIQNKTQLFLVRSSTHPSIHPMDAQREDIQTPCMEFERQP